MKQILFVFLTLIFSTSISCSQDKKVYDAGYLVKVGDTAPDFTINETGGRTYKLSDLRGKVVMLQFTASWCSVMALDPGAGIFGLFTQKEAGVTRNVIIGRNGKIIFLTRLYKKDEFNQMKKVIFAELRTK